MNNNILDTLKYLSTVYVSKEAHPAVCAVRNYHEVDKSTYTENSDRKDKDSN